MLERLLVACIIVFVFTGGVSAQGIKVDKDTLAAPQADLLDTANNAIPLFVSSILVSGNKVTKERIILRELSFKLNDSIPAGELKQRLVTSRQNLLNTSLFNFATITYSINGSRVNFKVSVIERWYTWPAPMFELAETNFNTWWLTKDFGRTYYGMYVIRENFRGLKESLKFKVQFGYAEQFALQYNVPYINKKQTIGMGITSSYSRNKEIAYKTIGNKRIFYRDFDRYVRSEFYTRLLLTLRNNIYNTNTFQVKYNHAAIEDTLTVLSNDYFHQNRKNTEYMVLGYEFRHDKRDFRAYPLKGHYFEIEGVKIGAGFFPDEPDFAYLTTTLKKFWKLNPKWYIGATAKSKFALYGNQSYYLQKGLGYGDLVRAYEYYVIDGQNWYLGKANVKYRLIAPQVRKFEFINNSKVNTVHYAMYLNLFADAGYVEDKYYYKQNPLANQFLFGYGVGIDWVTYYDKTLRFEYSFNRLGEHGFFLNATAPL